MRNKKFKKLSLNGFTLIEIMVSILIFSFLIVGIYSIMLVGNRSWGTTSSKVELQQNLRIAMESIIYDLSQASSSSIEDVPADSSSYSSITFKIPIGITGGTTIWSADTIQFILGGTNNDQLLRIEGVTSKIICKNIEMLQFSRNVNSPSIIDISLTAKKNTVQNEEIELTLNFSLQIRN